MPFGSVVSRRFCDKPGDNVLVRTLSNYFFFVDLTISMITLCLVAIVIKKHKDPLFLMIFNRTVRCFAHWGITFNCKLCISNSKYMGLVQTNQKGYFLFPLKYLTLLSLCLCFTTQWIDHLRKPSARSPFSHWKLTIHISN